jgi:hypothetical protein
MRGAAASQSYSGTPDHINAPLSLLCLSVACQSDEDLGRIELPYALKAHLLLMGVPPAKFDNKKEGGGKRKENEDSEDSDGEDSVHEESSVPKSRPPPQPVKRFKVKVKEEEGSN